MIAATLLVLTRGIHVAALLSAFGTALARAFVAPPALARATPADRRACEAEATQLLQLSLVIAAAFALLLLPFQTAEMAGADTIGSALSVMPDVLLHTGFGHALIARVCLLALAWPVFASGRSPFRALCAAELIGVALALQIEMGHAAAADDWDLPESLVLHLLGAGAWLGGLLPLLLLTRRLPPAIAAIAARRFSPVGIASMLLLALTAIIQTFLLVGGLPGLVGTDYGRIALAKLLLFVFLLGLAAANRAWFTPALSSKQGAAARTHLTRSIAVEMALGCAIILAGAWMATLAPGVHEQPLWPFAWRPSLDALSDPDLRGEVIEGSALLAGAVLLLGGMYWRRARWPALAGAILLAYLGLPHLDLLLVEAYPTSYYQSTSGFSAISIAQGAALFPQHCVSCHGPEGRGDGPQAAGLSIPPADLTAEHLWAHSDGELFWWIGHGMLDPEDKPVMPGFASILSDDDDLWSLIDYIRAANAGRAATDHWVVPLQAPDLSAVCDGSRMLDLTELRGQAVRIVAGDAPVPDVPDLPTIRLARSAADGTGCVAASDDDWQAYATIAGLASDGLAGTQFLIDGGGWLRQLWRPGDAPGWTEPAALAALARQVAESPLQAAAGGHHHH